MKKEEIQKLVELQNQRDEVAKINAQVNKATRFRIVPKNEAGAIGDFEARLIPGLNDALKEVIRTMIGDYLIDLDYELNGLILCKQNSTEPVYKPVDEIKTK